MTGTIEREKESKRGSDRKRNKKMIRRILIGPRLGKEREWGRKLAQYNANKGGALRG